MVSFHLYSSRTILSTSGVWKSMVSRGATNPWAPNSKKQSEMTTHGGAVFATGQSVRPGQGRGRTTFRRPVPSFPELARQARAKDQDGRHCVVPHRPTPSHTVPRRPLSSSVVLCRPLSSSVVLCRPLSSPAVFPCFPMLSAVFRRPPPSPAVPRRPRRSYVVTCRPLAEVSQVVGLVVLANDGRPGIKGRGRTTFCRPVSSGGLGSPSAGPYGAPGQLRTLRWGTPSPIISYSTGSA